MTVVRLTPADAAAFKAMRLESLWLHPDAYGSVAADWQDTPVEAFADRLRDSHAFGFYAKGVLSGIAVYDREKGGNVRHRALITAVYVRAAQRRQGGAQALFSAIEAQARADGVTQLELHVAAHNSAARALYAGMGFREVALIPNALISQGQVIDEYLMIRVLQTPRA